MKYPKIISISGSVHSGKTTISRMLAAEMPNAFYLDGDLLSAFIGKNYPDSATIDDMLPEVHKRIIELIQASLKSELDIIIDYPFTDAVRKQIIDALGGAKFETKWFLLKPDMQKVLTGSKTRPELNEWEIERIKYHYASDLMETNMAKIIDSTDQQPEETLAVILEEL